MFAAPESQPTAEGPRYYVALSTARTLPNRLRFTTSLIPDLDINAPLDEIKAEILKDLVHNKQLFKHPPTLSSLTALSPPWGVVLDGEVKRWSPTSTFRNMTDMTAIPDASYVHLVLEGLYVSRSRISPVFSIKFVSVIPVTPVAQEIEFDFDDAGSLEEVSDIPEEGGANVVLLTDPAIRRKAKADAKRSIKEAFVIADAAHEAAAQRAHAFLDEYDLSDNESGFSEWLTEDEDENEDELP
jgi:hypothetical protein